MSRFLQGYQIYCLVNSRIHSYSSNRCFQLEKRLFSTKDFVHGMEVELIDGNGRGRIIEKLKGGWFKCSILDLNGEENIIKLRSSQMKTLSTTTNIASIKENIKINNVPKLILESLSIKESTKEYEDYKLPYLIPPSQHINTRNWIIFSDLHVKGSSIDTCERILIEINHVAKERNAGIIFLGDFWHVRGALSVELLNRVLKIFRSWTQPVIMIPGNHDQVTLGGNIHALEPLLYAFPTDQAILISEPTICLGALWIPYRRDSLLMKSILKASSNHPDVNVIFCHADVRGAFMNDNMKSKEGIEVSHFPPNIPIFSGHFHKPHTMKQGGSQLRYVGSPYQTSLSEAGQVKYLYNLASTPISSPSNRILSTQLHTRHWEEEMRWEIEFGKKYFKAGSIKDSNIINSARPGDRLIIPVRIGEDGKADEIIQPLRRQGIEVELHYESSPRFHMKTSQDSIENISESISQSNLTEDGNINMNIKKAFVDHMDPLTIYDIFMKTANMNTLIHNDFASNDTSTSISNDTNIMIANLNQEVLVEGRKTIERLLGYAEAGHEGKLTSSAFSTKGNMKELRIESVKLKDFGPYGGDGVTYPLANRGLVLIKGKSSDHTGADSNGSGKTTLAMSVMWGLTGSMDTRLVTDGKAVNVAYDTGNTSDQRTAEVSVIGMINNQSFKVTRKRGKKSALLFELDGKDVTKQATKDTQATIDEELGIGNNLLQRCCFFGQHSHTMTSLLGLSDKSLKNELGSSSLVDVELWNTAQTDVRTRERKDKARINDLTVESRIREEEINRANISLSQANANLIQSQSDLSTARLNDPNRGSKDGNIHSRTIFEVESDLDLTRNMITKLTQSTIEPMRLELMTVTKRKINDISQHDTSLSSIREILVRYKTSIAGAMSSISNIRSKIVQLETQSRSIEATIKHMFSALFDGTSSTLSLTTVNSFGSTTAISNNLSNGNSVVDKTIHSSSNLLSTPVQVEVYRRAHESSLSELASLHVRIKTTETSLGRLQDIKQLHSGVTGVVHIDDHNHNYSHNHDHQTEQEKESCPTCGQSLSFDLQLQREQELRQLLNNLLEQRKTSQLNSENLRKKVDLCIRIKTAQDQWKSFHDRIIELQTESKPIESIIKNYQNELPALEKQLQNITQFKVKTENEYNKLEAELMNQIKATEKMILENIEKEKNLRILLDHMKTADSLKTISTNQYQASIHLLTERVKSMEAIVQEKQDVVDALRSNISRVDQEKQILMNQVMILERLGEVFGVRGIQHFVFMNIISQIESIANKYLLILAEGGIQITLQSEESEDKITKTILIRSASDGQYRERALSQLSGGQWRRVSLALDFAFTELVRRKGVLRSNLLVLDEILTHLDASGREAVGTVLRAMASAGSLPERLSSVFSSKPMMEVTAEESQTKQETRKTEIIEYVESDIEKDNDMEIKKSADKLTLNGDLSSLLVGGGTYETVLVILQDLVAMELEEAFDHIDVVVKEADVARVVLDE